MDKILRTKAPKMPKHPISPAGLRDVPTGQPASHDSISRPADQAVMKFSGQAAKAKLSSLATIGSQRFYEVTAPRHAPKVLQLTSKPSHPHGRTRNYNMLEIKKFALRQNLTPLPVSIRSNSKFGYKSEVYDETTGFN